jgi:hypothetical protein
VEERVSGPAWRRLVVSVLAVSMLTACGDRVDAEDAFGAEPLADAEPAGLQVLDERWLDGDDGGPTGKPSHATVSRTFRAEGGTSRREAMRTLVDSAERTGWSRVTAQSTSSTFVATKPLEEGPARLMISTAGLGAREVVLTMSLGSGPETRRGPRDRAATHDRRSRQPPG